jgi:hypothetical protein
MSMTVINFCTALRVASPRRLDAKLPHVSYAQINSKEIKWLFFWAKMLISAVDVAWITS